MPSGDPGVSAALRILRSCDAAVTNLETLFHDFESPAMPSGPSLRSDPRLAMDLARAGFDLVSRANNHAGDYGPGGMRTTTRHLEAAGIAGAGVGEDLPRARQAAVFQTPAGRVALVSAASTFPDHFRAGASRGRISGRPGVSPLRYRTTAFVSADQLEGVRSIRRSLGMNPPEGDRLPLGDLEFAAGDPPRLATEPLARDVEEIAAAVRGAAARADLVLVSIHSHESGADRSRPPDFLEAFARAMIDAGADVVAGHGPHVLRGIQIYRGKPIFYSLGNFLFEYDSLAALPADDYESIGLPGTAGVQEFFDRYDRGGRRGHPSDREVWESVVAVTRWRKRRLSSIELHPVELGFGRQGRERGEPRLARGETGTSILERLARLSAPFGTTIEIRDGAGRIGGEATARASDSSR